MQRLLFGLLASLGAVSAFGTTLTVDVRGRAAGDAVDQAVRTYAMNMAELTRRERTLRGGQFWTQPVSVRVVGSNAPQSSRGPGDIVLAFETMGDRAFPTQYRDFLQAIFDEAKPAMATLFGTPFVSGTVRVRNYDADLGDRDAVAGGVYLHDNGSGQREIRFPIYQDGSGIKPEVTAVNFVHTLLLAYQGGLNFPGDAWNEGLVRAVTARVVRTPGALPNGLDLDQIEGVLDSSYEVAGLYDWYNQPALSGPQFIAPNLVSAPLPVGGSTGGLYLMRYQMSGAAWQKVLAQYPTFGERLRARYLASGLPGTVSNLVALGQLALNDVGGAGSLVEGVSFSGWVRKQFILDTTLTPGAKLALQPFPIVDGLTGSDFGVFAIQAHAFDIATNGNETLSRETAFPIYWSPDFTRFFTSAQDDRLDIVQGYGAVVPNFNGGAFSGQPYRVTVDVPVQDRVARVQLPAGAIATATNPLVNNVFGTLGGVLAPPGTSYSVRLQFGSQTVNLPVNNFAFGGNIVALPREAVIEVTVLQTVGGGPPTPILNQTVNKTESRLGLQLQVGSAADQAFSVSAGVGVLTPTLTPFRTGAFSPFGWDPDEVLLARWNGLRGRFDLSTQVGNVAPGQAVFVRSNTAQVRNVSGAVPRSTPISIPLRPGWNFITSPFGESIDTDQIDVVVGSESPASFATARGVTLGTEMFQFAPGTPDPVTGLPESGSLGLVTRLPVGVGVYVRCLAPTGATLVVYPGDLRGRGLNPSPEWWQRPGAWGWRVSLSDGREDRATAEIGQGVGATRGFDNRWDSELPPSFGGPRLSVNNGYRDVRPWGLAERWSLIAEGLRPGQTYTVNLDPLARPPLVDLRDVRTGRRVRAERAASFTFRAISASHTFAAATRRVR